MQKNKMIFFLIIAVATLPLLVFSLLKKNEERNGGPCSYDIMKYPARVTAIEKADSTFFEVTFSVKRENTTEQLLFSQELGHFATAQEIKELGVELERVFTYEHHVRTAGHCSPEIFVLKMEEYR